MNDDRDNQIRRTARILEIIQQITLSPQYWTRKKLSEHHEISERMIQKDLEIIRVRLGLLLETDRSGYYFTYLPHLPSTLFSFTEAISLLSAARAAQVLPGINSSELAVAISRLESVFLRKLLSESLDYLPESSKKMHRQNMLRFFYSTERIMSEEISACFIKPKTRRKQRNVLLNLHQSLPIREGGLKSPVPANKSTATSLSLQDHPFLEPGTR